MNRPPRLSVLALVFALAVAAHAAESMLKIIGPEKTLTFTAEEFAALPHTELKLPPLGDKPAQAYTGVTMRELLARAGDVLDHLLFHDAAPLPEGVTGDRAFSRVFTADTPRSSHGDALKDFSGHGRLFANRCSFLIYSESFLALPTPLKDRVLDRLSAVLHGEDSSGRYAYLDADEKRRISEVLTETHPEARRHFLKLPP